MRCYTEDMATVVKKMTRAQIDALHERLQPIARKETKPEWTYWSIRTSDCSITAYTSGKVVYQGADLSWLEQDENKDENQKISEAQSKPRFKASGSRSSKARSALSRQSEDAVCFSESFPAAGSDEVGTGDYFGPIVVAAVLVENEETARRLQALKITDSKAMTDAWILKVGGEVAALVPHSVRILANPQYNALYDRETMHIKRILAIMHNEAWKALRKDHPLPENSIVDQFCVPRTYFSYLQDRGEIVHSLHFETKAESKHIAVAAASVLARYAFLKSMEKMEKRWGCSFAKGAGARTDADIRAFAEKHGRENLVKVAKLHFANTEKALR